MKKILLSTAILISFSLSVILFEISCKKSATAQSTSTTTTTTTTQQNKMIYLLYKGADANNRAIYQITSANYDGSNPQAINTSLPSGVTINDNSLALSPDHKTIFFSAGTPSGEIDLYSCNFDGSNITEVVSNGEHPIPY